MTACIVTAITGKGEMEAKHISSIVRSSSLSCHGIDLAIKSTSIKAIEVVGNPLFLTVNTQSESTIMNLNAF